jgi:putative spermidine/putrescine transport system permease protein
MRITRGWALLLIGLPIAFLVAFFFVPFAIVVIDSFRVQDGTWTLANYRKAIGDPFYWEVLLITFRLSLWVTIAAFLIGYPLAYFIVRMVDSRLLRSMLYIVVVTPLFTSNIVRAFGWIVLLGRRGLVNDAMIATGITERPIPLLYGESSIVIGLTYIMVPFMVLTIASVLQNIDRALEEAARDLGAGAWSTFWRVTFPLSMPGVIAGALIVFTLSVSAYVTPSILSGGRQNTTSILIFQQYASILDFHFGGALAVVLLVTTIILVSVSLIGANRRQQVAS